MSGCRSCSGYAQDTKYNPTTKAEKLEKTERSDNPRYPHVFVGKQAIYTDSSAQMIVNVVADTCNEECDCFSLKPVRILKDKHKSFAQDETFEVSKQAGDDEWKLAALI